MSTTYTDGKTASIDANGNPAMLGVSAIWETVPVRVNPTTGAMLVEAAWVTITWPVTVSNEVEITNSSWAPIPISAPSPLPTDVRASASAQAVTPSDSTNLTGTARALYVGTGGNVVAIISGTAITFTNVQDGSILPVACTRINATNTTATNMVALY